MADGFEDKRSSFAVRRTRGHLGVAGIAAGVIVPLALATAPALAQSAASEPAAQQVEAQSEKPEAAAPAKPAASTAEPATAAVEPPAVQKAEAPASESPKVERPAAKAETAPAQPADVGSNEAASAPAAQQPAISPVTNSEADPLTPTRVEGPPPAAPGAGEKRAAAPAGAVDPIVTEVRRLAADQAVKSATVADDRAAVTSFYADGTNEPVWTSKDGYTPRATAAMEAMKHAADWGLDASAFDLPLALSANASVGELAAAEIKLSQAVLKYARHARGGRIPDPTSLSKMIDMKPTFFEPRSVLDAISVTADAGRYLEGLNPQHEGFMRLRKALIDLRGGGAAVHEETTSAGDDAGDEKPRRKGAKTTKSASAAKPASKATRSDLEQRIAVNMERWRWLPDDLGSFYVNDNVPEQYTRVYRDGKIVLQEKIVVGKPNTPTPSFSADMKFVIFHPSWGVPPGIKSNELAPMLRRASQNKGFWLFGGDSDGASRALARHELKVFHNGRPVNPDSIDWSTANISNFHFTQPPSAKNVLGVVKFRFPNKHDVYMHDTPERHLFNNGQRSFSHGCMRVQNPIHLAEVILAHDKGWSAEKVRDMSKSAAEITLDKKTPVHITYFTVTVDDDGKLRQHGDLYGLDGRVASALTGRSVQLAAASATPQEESPRAASTSTPREGKREKTSRSRVSKKNAAAEPFNPFSGLFAN